MPPAAGDELRHDNGNSLIGLTLSRDLLDVANQRFEEQPIRGMQDNEADPLSPPFPLGAYPLGFSRIHGDVDRRDVVGERSGVAERGDGAAMDAADGHDHPVPRHALGRAEVLQRQVRGQVSVVVMDGEEYHDHRWHKKDDDPRPVAELGDGEDQHHDRRTERAESVDPHLERPTWIMAERRAALLYLLARREVADLPPATGHAGLRKREGKEHPNGVQWDEGGHAGLEQYDQERGNEGEDHDTTREDETTTSVGELAGQKAVAGMQGT